MTTRRVIASIGAAGLAVALTACSPIEYHGFDSGIDGVLWRQINHYEGSMRDGDSYAYDAPSFLESLRGLRWDRADAIPPNVQGGGVVFYDLQQSGSAAQLSVFISSGPRPDAPTDEGRPYGGPSQVYTCYGIAVDGWRVVLTYDREIFTECPAVLVEQLPEDAAFASGEVFDG